MVPGGFTYAEVGATRGVCLLPGSMTTLRLRRRVGDRSDFESAADFVLRYGMQRGAGLEVHADSAYVREGELATVVIRCGPLRLQAPTRVVYVVKEEDRRGFAYGTLPGHPECGEEAFLVERDAESTWAEVRAFSRAGQWVTRLGGPLARLAQRRVAGGYLDAVETALSQSLTRGERAW